jgi:phosphoribosylformimino-5-aminoimidazole carboxamide ribotide isomerase
MASFEIIPAIDLRDGRCVRLFQGDFTRETVFGYDPVQMALRWQEMGATRLHVIDLDGARAGTPVQLPLVGEIVRALRIPIQLGGGLRQMEDINAALAHGVSRVVVGTAAIGNGDHRQARTFRQACRAGQLERVVISLDARDGKLAVRGWTENTQQDVFGFARRLKDEGFQRIIYTDISRDGALSGPNIEHVRWLAQVPGLAVIASGGVGCMAHLEELAATGAEGAILGQALYTGSVTLPEAIERLASIPGRA